MLKQYTCILCPRGCDLTAEVSGDAAAPVVERVTGNTCLKGAAYATQEVVNPLRNIASSVLVLGGELPLCSVRLSAPIPLAQIFPVMNAIRAIRVPAPVHAGDVLLPDVLGLGADVIATKTVLIK